MKETTTWHSERLHREMQLVRWGEVGVPVLLFPTAGGDAEEIERFLVIDALSGLLSEGRIKVYSVDSVAGRALATSEGSPHYRGLLQDAFQEFIYHEVVSAIRTDCQSDDVEVITAGSSIGAFNALAHLVRYPHVFSKALCMSGTFDLMRFVQDGDPGTAFHASSPLHTLRSLEGEHLEKLCSRFVLLASGEGAEEDIEESWRVASALGAKGVPNRVDSWGADRDHDWPLWREMLPKYLGEWT